MALLPGQVGLARTWIFLALLAAAPTVPSRAWARCPVDPEIGGEAAMTTAAAERIDLLERRLAQGAHNSRAWSLGWGVGLGLLSVGQLAIAPFTPSDERAEWWVGAGASGFGALTRAVLQPRVFRERRKLARDGSGGCARVAALEGALVRSAKWERDGRGILMTGLSLGFNAGVGLLLGLAFDRPVAGNRLASIGAVIGELMIITQPTFLDRALREYKTGTPPRVRAWSSGPWLTPGGGGFALRGRL